MNKRKAPKVRNRPCLGRYLKLMGIPNSFFTQERTKGRVKKFQEVMHFFRGKGLIKPELWNKIAEQYGYINPITITTVIDSNTLTIGNELETTNNQTTNPTA